MSDHVIGAIVAFVAVGWLGILAWWDLGRRRAFSDEAEERLRVTLTHGDRALESRIHQVERETGAHIASLERAYKDRADALDLRFELLKKDVIDSGAVRARPARSPRTGEGARPWAKRDG